MYGALKAHVVYTGGHVPNAGSSCSIWAFDSPVFRSTDFVAGVGRGPCRTHRRVSGQRGRRIPDLVGGWRGRHRPEGRRISFPHGLLTEPRRREPGCRLRTPDRPELAGDRLPLGHEAHHRGADCPASPQPARTCGPAAGRRGPAGESERRGVAGAVVSVPITNVPRHNTGTA